MLSTGLNVVNFTYFFLYKCFGKILKIRSREDLMYHFYVNFDLSNIIRDGCLSGVWVLSYL